MPAAFLILTSRANKAATEQRTRASSSVLPLIRGLGAGLPRNVFQIQVLRLRSMHLKGFLPFTRKLAYISHASRHEAGFSHAFHELSMHMMHLLPAENACWQYRMPYLPNNPPNRPFFCTSSLVTPCTS